MTTDVHSVTPQTPLKDVGRTLAEFRVSGVPVVDGEHVVGVVSEADILVKEQGHRVEHSGLGDLRHPESRDVDRKLDAETAAEAMTAPAVTITRDRPIAEAAATMIQEHVNRLPVVDQDG